MSNRASRQPQEQRDIDVSATRTRTRGKHAIKFSQRRPDPLSDGDRLTTKMARDELCEWIEQQYQDASRQGAESQQAVEPHRSFFQNQAGFGSLAIIEPPFNFNALMRLPRENNMLRQCVDAMVTNCEGHGWRLEYVGPEEQREGAEAQDERRMLRDFLEFPNADHSLQELRQRLRRDLETLGNAFIEVSQDDAGRMALLAHVPAHSVRLTMVDQELVETRVRLPREGRAVEQQVRRRFRRFVQVNGSRMIWFKEFGDPRDINAQNGRADEGVPEEDKATAIIHLRLYAPGTPYGIPRWINQMPAILGSRQAELTNLDFFQENAIPAMAILVSGGNVTQESIDDIEEQFTANRGRESFNRVLLVEAKGDQQAGSADGQLPAPKVDMKPMQSDRQKDALFQVFDQNNMTKIRSSFRLPPIFVGFSQDYTHATAKTSFEVAESQVFGPERQAVDDMINQKILSTFSPRFWSFRSNPPRISDPQDVMDAVQVFEDAGAMTPNIAIGLANEFFDLEIQEIEEAWGDVPFTLFRNLVTAASVHLPDPDTENGELAAVAALLQQPSREEREVMAAQLREQGPQNQPPQQQGDDDQGGQGAQRVRTRTRTRRRHKITAKN